MKSKPPIPLVACGVAFITMFTAAMASAQKYVIESTADKYRKNQQLIDDPYLTLPDSSYVKIFDEETNSSITVHGPYEGRLSGKPVASEGKDIPDKSDAAGVQQK